MRRPKVSPQRPPRLALTLGLVAIAAAAGWLALGSEGPVRYTGIARVELPLPLAASSRALDQVDPALPRNADALAASSLDPSLIEDGPFGPLPRIGPDGRRPLFAYARPFNFEDARPKVAVLVLGLGLRAELFDAALALPGAIGLQLSPYAPDLAALVERARHAGYEVLLGLPMEPADYPASDPGPHTLLADSSRADNLKRLDWVLARAPGYVAVAGAGAGFAGSEHVAAVLDVLARRGLALIELGASQLETAAAAAGLPYASAAHAIDQEPAALSIDFALAGLEAEALAGGSALGVAHDHPVTLERLRRWAATLEGKGLVLAPVSAVLIEQSGLARGAGPWPARRRPA
jgi:polysaccharide deacetylase 2 family uncharacterized protein YibQ